MNVGDDIAAPQAPAASPAEPASLCDRLGGPAAVEAVVGSFYSRVTSDSSLSRFFENMNMDHLKKMQADLLIMAFGGPNNYTGQDLRSAHTRLVADGMDDSHFGAVAGHLLATLNEFNVDKALVDEVMTIAASTHDDVLNVGDNIAVTQKEAVQEAPVSDDSLFNRLGGDAAIDAVVDAFYSRVFADPRLSKFFENTDPEFIKKQQRDFLAMAFGGPNNYSGADMRTAHARLVADGLDTSHFGFVAEHLLGVLQDFQVEQGLIDEVMTIAASTHDDVVGL